MTLNFINVPTCKRIFLAIFVLSLVSICPGKGVCADDDDILLFLPAILAGAASVPLRGGTPGWPDDYTVPERVEFCHEWYLDTYPDVKASPWFRTRPYEHYVLFGKSEGRLPCPPTDWPHDYTVPSGVVFWRDWYLSQNEDVRTSPHFWCRPYEHYVTAGKAEGRLPFPSSSGPFTEIAKIYDYLWFMASKDNYLYTGAYRLFPLSHKGNDNYYYRLNLNNGVIDSYKMASLDESTRVYNLGGDIYTTTEGGVVWKNGVSIGNLGTHFVLGGERHNNANLISRAWLLPNAITEIFDCTGNTCNKITTVNGVFGFHMTSHNGALYTIGAGPDGYRNEGSRVYKGSQQIYSRNDKTAVRGISFGGKLYVGLSYNAEILSYNGAWQSEKIFHDMNHFGDFAVWKNQLYAVVVKEAGSPEVWFKNSNGNWELKLSQTQLSKYGVSGDLVNAAGFFTVTEDNRLFMNINTSWAGRNGPGYILEIN